MAKAMDLNKFQEVVSHLKTKQHQLKNLVSKETLKDAKKYAETSKKELQKLLKSTDVKKVKAFIEKEAKEMHKLQARLPQELAKFSKFVETQKKEFEKLLKHAHASDAAEFIGKKMGASVGLKKKSKASLTGAKKSTKKMNAKNNPNQMEMVAPDSQSNQ
ncbi:MAG: hypothetical protein H7333_00195, partial [Bdellovibrionales bacterium]|nr:hypothetical protein [Oligoflexia bacterium]